MLQQVVSGRFTLSQLAHWMSDAPARVWGVLGKGRIAIEYDADLVLVDLHHSWTVTKENILAKCGWSPFEGQTFQSTVISTFVNGNMVYDQGQIIEGTHGERLTFDR